jgi:putative toxin-antitoxin system antitoxin component (TIGR02293 family)
MAKLTRYRASKSSLPKPSEPPASYQNARKNPVVSDYPYKKLKKIMDLVPFTQAEWAAMLHISERTLQRYAKNNTSFEGLHTDRILLLQEMIQLGLETFTDAQALNHWLHSEKSVMGQKLNFESLYTENGIQSITDQIGRIQQGVYT